TTDGVRLAQVHEVVGQGEVAEKEAPSLALHIVAYPQRIFGNEAVVRYHPAHVRRVVDVVQILRTEAVHYFLRAVPDRLPVGPQRAKVDPGAEISDLVRGHAGAKIAARHI